MREVATRTWHREVNGVRNNIAEAPEIQGALVRDHGYVLAEREPGGDYLLAWRGRIVAETVDPHVASLEGPRLCVIREECPAVAIGMRLRRGEVASLLRGKLEQA